MNASRIRLAGSLAWLTVLLLAGCAHRPPEPTSTAPSVNPAAPVVEPHHASGSYIITTDLKATQPTTPPARSRGRARRPPPATLRLAFQPTAAPDATATSSTQLSATINLPGYTRAPPGRAGQTAVWWPLPGDSVIVHFATPRGDGQMDLRGALQGDTLSGEIWYTSSTTGNVFQMGTFKAVRQKS